MMWTRELSEPRGLYRYLYTQIHIRYATLKGAAEVSRHAYLRVLPVFQGGAGAWGGGGARGRGMLEKVEHLQQNLGNKSFAPIVVIMQF